MEKSKGGDNISHLIDLTGQRFGKLLVIEKAPNRIAPSGQVITMWKCMCDCGNETVVSSQSLRKENNGTKSCGCLHGEKHGMSNTRLYRVWASMKRRCNNPNVERYAKYGGRGIKVCKEWGKSFLNFYEWSMTHSYDPNAEYGECTLDRIDPNGDYCPENCRWTSMTVQGNNKTDNRYLEYGGTRHTIAEWARIVGLPVTTITQRLRRGWSTKDTIETPYITTHIKKDKLKLI